MKRISRIGLIVACCWALHAAATGEVPTVIVLSWDGMRHDYPGRASFPGLERMARNGLRADRLTPVFPSNTFPGHVSLATGTYPDRHGIVDNLFFDRDRGRAYRMSSDADWIQAEPLWIAAERQGLRAATYFWVGSESDWRGKGTTYRVAPFDGSRPESAKVDQILAWLRLPAARRPQLVMSYWAGADAVGHRFGPDSDLLIAQIAEQDEQLQRLLTGIDGLATDPMSSAWHSTTLIIVSDHGMAESDTYIDLRGILAEAGIGARVSGGAVAQVYVEADDDRSDALAGARRVLESIDEVTVYLGAELPRWMRLTHPARTGDFVVTTEPPNTFSRPAGFEGGVVAAMTAVGWTFGNHGYRPERADMGGIFFALGRGVSNGVQIPAVHQVDVAATVARLLGIDPPLNSEGQPVPGIGDALHSGARPD